MRARRSRTWPRLSRALLLFMAGGALAAAVGVVQQQKREDRAAANREALALAGARMMSGTRIFYNGQAAMPKLADSGQDEIRSVLNVTDPMHYGDYVWDEQGVPDGPVQIRVDLTTQIISVFRGGHEIGSAVILYGSDGKPTPLGRFPVLQKDADYHSRTYDAPMPYMLRLTDDGVAIHGSHVRRGWATHGCIGVPLAFARLLFEHVRPGDMVTIVRDDPPSDQRV